MRRHRSLSVLLLLSVVLAVAPVVTAGAQTGADEVRIEVLSNRADLISGGDALVEVIVPDGAEVEPLRADVDGRDVSDQIARRDNGRIMGRITGLEEGANVLTVLLPDGSGARITIHNHPVGGPVFSGEQLQPWLCTTQDNDLGEPIDEQCNAETRYDFFYVSTNPLQSGFQEYDPDDPADDVATTTTDEGNEVPFIVRRERGTANRGIYDIAVLYDPEQPFEPWDVQEGWNHKVVYPFGASCGTLYHQASPSDVMDEAALGAGFAVANSSLNVLGDNCNTIISAESAMMLKERIVEQYGEVRYTIGNGCSGGSIGQHMVANNYPGLVDGIQPNCSYTDNWSTGGEVVDCHLLLNYFTTTSPHLWQVEAQRAAVTGHASTSSCAAWEALFVPVADPTTGCGLPEEQTYDPDTNPDGTRCTLQDFYVHQIGTRDGDGFAKFPYDNVGFQYGLQALDEGVITVEQFVDLNEKIGAIDVDLNFIEERREADPGSVEFLYRTGQVNDGGQLDRVPIIDLRGSSNLEIHTDYHSFAMKQRLRDANGHADNHVVWRANTPLVMPPGVAEQSFALIDEWLAAVEDDPRDVPLEQKVVDNRPDDAVDGCFVGNQMVTDDQDQCDALVPYFASPRIVAGAPISHDVVKCQLKPLDRDAYAVEFTDEQWARMEATYPDGVCDFSRPAAGRQPSVPWMTFADGPGGEPLGPAPTSATISGAPLAAGSLGSDDGAAVAGSTLPATGGGLALAAVALVLVGFSLASRAGSGRGDRGA